MHVVWILHSRLVSTRSSLQVRHEIETIRAIQKICETELRVSNEASYVHHPYCKPSFQVNNQVHNKIPARGSTFETKSGAHFTAPSP